MIVTAVVGAQYGSEGKGVLVNKLANQYKTHVRTGGPNAGHSFYYEGEVYKMQIIPCGWTNPKAQLIIGRGALVDVPHLLEEVEMLENGPCPDIRDRLFVDAHAGVLSEMAKKAEGGVEGEMHSRIGSTGEGVGSARVLRIARDSETFQRFGDVAEQYGLEDICHAHTPELINSYWAGDVLLEGTQGSALSLIHGPWPFVTSHDTNAATMAADAGVPPHKVSKVILVARTYPIRVAGNSGPMKGELDWGFFSERFGRPVEERTTVTKKIRRVGTWDDDLFHNAVVLNDPHEVALMFADYLDPSIEGATSPDQLTTPVLDFISQVERDHKVNIRYVGTGGRNSWEVIDRWV